jgi:nucleoside-diphosphate kinase
VADQEGWVAQLLEASIRSSGLSERGLEKRLGWKKGTLSRVLEGGSSLERQQVLEILEVLRRENAAPGADEAESRMVGELLGRFERRGLTIVALDMRTIDGEQADRHYAEHVERDFYPPLRTFVTSGPLVALVLEGDSAIEVVRGINGATDGRKAAPGTIRGDLSLSNRENLVHGSDSPESAEREIGIWFPGL